MTAAKACWGITDADAVEMAYARAAPMASAAVANKPPNLYIESNTT